MVGLAPGPVVAGEQPATTFTAGKTGKERLTDKSSDEQRVDDCKVPRARRTPRPADGFPGKLNPTRGSGASCPQLATALKANPPTYNI